MKIESVTARWAHVPIPKAQQHRSDLGVADFFDATIVRIETACGLVGWGGGQGLGRQHGQQRGSGGARQPRPRPGADRRGPARSAPAVGDRLQRRPRSLRPHARPQLPGAGPPRRQDQRDRGHRHGLLGHPGALPRRAGVAASRRQVPGLAPGLRLRRLGAGRGDRRTARRLYRPRRLPRREDARRRRRRRPRDLGAPGPGRPRPSRRRHRHHGGRPRAPIRSRRRSASRARSRTATSPGSRSR